MMHLRFTRGNKNTGDDVTGTSAAATAASIFSNLTNTAMSITGSGSSIVHGSSAMERAAATAAANTQSQQPPQPYAPSDGDNLPPGWRLVSSRATGRDYYLHLATNATQWDKPTESEPRKGAEQAVAHHHYPQQQQQRSGGAASVFSTSAASRFGANLTSMLSQANSRIQTTLATTAVTTTTHSNHNNPKLATPARLSSQDVDRDHQQLVEVFENERLDGKALDLHTDPKRFSDRDAAPASGTDALPDAGCDLLPSGYEWGSAWEIDLAFTAVDRDGWTYAADFAEVARLLRDDLSHATRHPTDAVRRRRWIRFRQLIESTDSSSSTNGHQRTSASPRATSDVPTTWHENDPLSSSYGFNSSRDMDDDPFQRTAAKQQSGFRVVGVKFPHRGTKDATKDYQSIALADVLWLVNATDDAAAPTDELLREKTANLEEQIKDATARSVELERTLRTQHDAKQLALKQQQHKFDALVAQYKKIASENAVLETSVAAHRATVDALRKEATEKDMLANEEQRALNAEMTAANQALEEKAKALATARMRYKRDNKTLAATLDAAKKRLAQHKAKASDDAQDPLANDLKTEMDKVRALHAKMEAVRQHRLAVEEESKALFNQVVEKKADLKFKSKKKMETALKEVDAKLQSLKTEQADLSKRLAQKPEGDALRQLNTRRNDIRSELGALKERRTMLLAEKRKQEGVEL